MAEVQVVDHGYKHDKKFHKYKKYYEQHHVHGHVGYSDFAENGCIWLFLGLLLLVILTFGILYWTVPPASAAAPPAFRLKKQEFLRQQNMRLIPKTPPSPAVGVWDKTKHTRDVRCKTGETFDVDLQMCGPTFFTPLAFDGSIMDTSRAACDSFYHSMCGRWIAQHTNENRAFTYGYHKNMERIKKLITTAPATSSLGKFYASCLTVTTGTSLGSGNPSGSSVGGPTTIGKRETIITLKHTMERVLGDMRSHGDLPTVFGRLARLGYTTPFTIGIERHPIEPRMLPLLMYDSFPASLDEGRIYQIMHHYQDVTHYNILETQQRITSLLKIMREMRLHNTQPAEEITDVADYVTNQFPSDLVRFETLRDWNLKGYGPTRGWNLYFQALDGQSLRFHHDQEVWVLGRPYMRWLLSEGLASYELSEWRAFIEFSIIYNGVQFEPELPTDSYFRQHDKQGPLGFGGRLYHRVPRTNTSHVLTPMEKCVRVTHAMVPGLVAHAFLDTYFGADREAIRSDVSKMVTRLRAVFVDRINASPWLSAPDKAAIATKMAATLIRVAEPDEWEVEPFAPRIEADRYDHNMNLVRMYRVQRNLGLWHKDLPNSLDRNAIAFFAMPLTDTNAYYSGSSNTITVLAGLLQPPFYSTSYNQISKFAILGSVIGHEMSHMLDYHGLYWDKDGSLRLRGILSDAGMREFYNQSDCVISEYGPAPAGCEDVNVAYGNKTVGEDLADLTGISLSYDAYFKHTDAGVAAPLGDKQHFFMVLSQAFCETYDQAHKCEAVKSDEHAIAEFRIDRTLRNLPAFQEAFGCHTGQGMYKKEQDMCRVY